MLTNMKEPQKTEKLRERQHASVMKSQSAQILAESAKVQDILNSADLTNEQKQYYSKMHSVLMYKHDKLMSKYDQDKHDLDDCNLDLS